jgi:2,3-bisphosphoglycerate-dependent phosphoglycerate mutase
MAEIPKSFTYRITLLRHGESAGNAKGLYQGRAEFDLTEKGRAQVESLAAYWQAEEAAFNQIISSPQSRARQTAEILSKSLSTPIEFDDNWREIDNGSLAGKTLSKASQTQSFPDFMSPFDSIGETGESNWDLYLRAGTVVQNLIHRPAGSFLIVSHGGFLNRVLYVMLGIFPQANFRGARFHFQNTSYAVVYYDPKRHIWLLDRLNDRNHLLNMQQK